MASFYKRGGYQWEARIRRRGYPTVPRTGKAPVARIQLPVSKRPSSVCMLITSMLLSGQKSGLKAWYGMDFTLQSRSHANKNFGSSQRPAA
jgi:hypothetical protein